MKVLPIIVGGVLALALGQSVWASDQDSSGQPGGSTSGGAVTQDLQAAVPVPAETGLQARDKDGRPMTPEEFAKADEARIKARTATSTNRLETRQSKWKKAPKSAAKKPPTPKGSGEPAPGPNVAPQ